MQLIACKKCDNMQYIADMNSPKIEDSDKGIHRTIDEDVLFAGV